MTFINEYASEEDIKKYRLEEINKECRKVSVRYDWTVDHERDMYLRWIGSGREEYSHEHEFHFYWKGTLIGVTLKRRGDGVRGGRGWTEWSLRYGFDLTKFGLNDEKEQVLKDFKDALIAFKDFGKSSTITEHTAKFTF